MLAGVDDLTARRQFGLDGQPVDPRAARAAGRHDDLPVPQPAGGGARRLELGVDLMLSGHTHDGQIWPFTYFVRLAYPRVVGRYEVNGMALIVSRGTGFWGPPMRLFRRSEIVAVTLTRG